MRPDQLRAGDLVEVRGAAEILATLDDVGAFEGLLFMPEMVRHCGRRFVVDKRADKMCDTIKYSGSRKLPDSVMLAGLRCDGAGHEGCQAECVVFWKEAWLRRVTLDQEAPPPSEGELAARKALVARLAALTKKSPQLYRCQGTELCNATQHLRTLDPRPYVGELLSGNVSF